MVAKQCMNTSCMSGSLKQAEAKLLKQGRDHEVLGTDKVAIMRDARLY